MKNYRVVRIPSLAYENFKQRKSNMEEQIRKITGKPIRIPLTKIIAYSSFYKISLYDGELIKMFKGRGKRWRS